MFKIWHINDFGSKMLATIVSNAQDLPVALPWIEPSINNLHLESAYSFLVGNYESAIISMSSLLEHVLRLAVTNKDQCGLHRAESMKQIDKYGSLSDLIAEASGKDIFNGCDEVWWCAVSTNIRNKSAHYLLPTLLRKCAVNPKLEKYINKYEMPENNEQSYYERYITDWGSFYHNAGRYMAKGFLSDATQQIKIIIDNTNWVGDTSWWISQKGDYDHFFAYNWSADNIKNSFNNAYTNRGI